MGWSEIEFIFEYVGMTTAHAVEPELEWRPDRFDEAVSSWNCVQFWLGNCGLDKNYIRQENPELWVRVGGSVTGDM